MNLKEEQLFEEWWGKYDYENNGGLTREQTDDIKEAAKEAWSQGYHRGYDVGEIKGYDRGNRDGYNEAIR